MGKKEIDTEVDDHYGDDVVVAVDSAAQMGSERMWREPRFSSVGFSRVFKPKRPLSVQQSQQHLLDLYAGKSDTRKGGITLTTDQTRVHMPGDMSFAELVVGAEGLDKIERIDVELKAQVHTYTIINSGQSRSVATTKEYLFTESASIHAGTMDIRLNTAHIWLERPDANNPSRFTARAQIPIAFYLQSSRLRTGTQTVFPAPSSFRDHSKTRAETAFVTYHWKVTRVATNTFKSNDRHWRPIIVVASSLDVRRDPQLTTPLRYPPVPTFRRSVLQREIRKNVFRTGGLMELEICMPDFSRAHPMFRPVPVVLRCSVRAKTPSDLLEMGGAVRLPELPDRMVDVAVADDAGQAGGPTFWVQRDTYCRARGGNFERTTARSACKTKWSSQHVGTGFRPGKGSEGFEDGREGTTPKAAQQAAQGQAHGWLWPVRDTEQRNFASPEAAAAPPPGSAAINGAHPDAAGALPRVPADSLAKFPYVTTATLFGFVYPEVVPRIEIPKLRVYYTMSMLWPMDGMRNDVDVTLGEVGVTLGIHPSERAQIRDSDLRDAVLYPATFDPQGLFLRDAPPPPPAAMSFAGDVDPGASTALSRGKKSAWLPSYLPTARPDTLPTYSQGGSNLAASHETDVVHDVKQ